MINQVDKNLKNSKVQRDTLFQILKKENIIIDIELTQFNNKKQINVLEKVKILNEKFSFFKK